MVVLSLQKYVPKLENAIRIRHITDEFIYSKYDKNIIKNYIYYPQKRLLA